MLSSLRTRLLATYLLVTGLVLVIVGVSLLILLLGNPIAQRQVYNRLELLATFALEREDRLVQPAVVERVQTAAQRLGLPEGRLLVLGPGGEVVADSRPDLSLPPRVLLRQAAAGQAAGQGEYRDPNFRRWLYVVAPLGEGRAVLLAAPGLTWRALLTEADELLTPLVQAGLLALLVSVLLAWLISRWVSAPLRRMADAAQAVAQGDYERRIPLSGPAEARSLAADFNEMVQRVQSGRQAQRDFVANVSHDLKTPLTSIQGFAQAILDGTADDAPSRQRAAQIIYEESDRLRRMVDGLLDLARLDAGQMIFSMGVIDLAAIVRGVVERLERKAVERGMTIENLVDSAPAVIGDGDRLAQVFTNLVDNAVTHTPPGGTVTLRGEIQPGWFLVHVDDTGPGIPPDELSRVFERFYQLDRARQGGEGRGAGLGLAISREIAQAHGGQLTASSTPGQGSRFTLRLPLARTGDTTPVRRRR